MIFMYYKIYHEQNQRLVPRLRNHKLNIFVDIVHKEEMQP